MQARIAFAFPAVALSPQSSSFCRAPNESAAANDTHHGPYQGRTVPCSLLAKGFMQDLRLWAFARGVGSSSYTPCQGPCIHSRRNRYKAEGSVPDHPPVCHLHAADERRGTAPFLEFIGAEILPWRSRVGHKCSYEQFYIQLLVVMSL